MKRCFVLFLMLAILLLSACKADSQIQPSGAAESAGEIPSPTATPTPDFASTDFSGRWYVSDIIDSNGMSVSDAEKQTLDAGFILELLPTGTYFVYGADGKALGQGTYSIALNQLTLTALGIQTVYEIIDAETLRITQPDTSVTIMKREAVEAPEGGEVVGGEGEATGGEGEEPSAQTPTEDTEDISDEESGF